MYTDQLGSPAAVVVTATQLYNVVAGLFKKSIDPNRKAAVDTLAKRAMTNVRNIAVSGTTQFDAVMRLKCLAGDPNPIVLQYYQRNTDATFQGQCGCATDACKEYAATTVREIERAAAGLPPTVVSSSNDGTGVHVDIPVKTSQLEIAGIPVVYLGLGLLLVGYAMAGKGGRR